MSNPPPGLGGSGGGTGAIRGPPPGFGSPSSMSSSRGGGGASTADGSAGTTSIIKAQISFLVSSLVDETYEKAANEVRSLASSIMPEMYHHFLRRSSHIASPVLQTLYQHYARYQDDPAAPPPSIPSSGHPTLNWRLLNEEAVRASRDINLSAHFTMIMLSPSAGTPLPVPSLRIFNLSPSQLFSLAAYTLASPSIFPPTHPSFDSVHTLLRQTYAPTMDILRSPNVPFWSQAHESSEDLTLQEARTLILALYPRSQSSGDASSRPATPTNPTSPHPSPLTSEQRTGLLSSLSIKFSSPAIVLQTLSALSPGGAPRSPGSIPLEDVLFELGETLTQDEGTVEAVLYRWWGTYLLDGATTDKQAVTEEAGRAIIGLFEGLHEGRSIDLHGVVKGMTSIESIDFAALVRTLDVPHTPAAYPSSINFLIALLMIPPQQPVPPISGLLPADLESSSWTHTESLLAILTRLSVMAPDRLPVFLIPNAASPSSYARIIDPPSNDQAMSTKLKQSAVDLQSAGMWNILGLFRVLVEACTQPEGDTGEQNAEAGRMAMSLLDRAAEVVPEMTLVAFEKLPGQLPPALHDMHRRLLGMYLSNPFAQIQSSQLVFHTLKRVNLPGLLDVLLEFYQENESNLGRVLGIAQEVKVLDKLLGADNVFYALDVACLAATEKYINLEKWLSDGIDVKDHDFLEGIFDFVENKVRAEIDAKHQPDSAQKPPNRLDIEVYSIFIRVIRRAPDLSREDISRFKHLRTDILIVNPKLLNLRPGSTEEQGFTVAKFDKAMTEQADKMFQRMYGGHIQLDDVISELKRLLKSDDPNDNETFACAMHALFDEHAFVKNYPPNELTMTGILFGAIIDYRLVKDIPAFVATRYVLDACKTPPHEPVYQFGINALSILRASLVDFPGLCRSLLEIPALHESHPVLINDIMSALAEREDLDQQGGVKLAFPALKLPIMVEEGVDEFVEPEPAKKDRIMFIINQIDPSNYDARSKDLIAVFEDQYSRWFAHYFIDVRVSLEQNRHEIYMQLLEAIKSPVLDRHVLWETYRKARDLLNSEATINSAAERATLKTVALWLGRITLARNIPLRLRDLSLKDLLIQGFDNQRLIVAIPFVCNLLSQCEHSSVFHLPNPWLASILKLLIEFYHFATLKLNLKFEIEVLFKNKLYVDKDKIEPSAVLRTHVPPPAPQEDKPDRLQQEYQRATAELENESQRFQQPPLDPDFARMQAFQNEQAAQAAQDAFMRRVEELVATLPEYLVFSPEYPVFTAPTLQRIVHHSINRAVRDIVQPVVERSVTIAGISSRDLVQKDFGMEGDASKMRHSAHLMVQNLAGNLAIVTCKEPLRSSMMNNIRTMLAQNGFTEENMPDAMIAGVVNDNLDAGCGVIRKAAMEKAVKDIDVNLSPQYAARRAHREAGSRQPFWDGASFGVALSHAALPDALRLHSGGLGPAQLRVYDDFGEPSRILQQTATNGDYGYQERQERLLAEQGRRGPSPLYPDEPLRESREQREPRDRAPSPRVLSAQAALEKFQEVVLDLEKHLAQAPSPTLVGIAPDSVIRSLMRGLIYVANNSSNREGTTLVIAQKVVQLLYKTATGLGREVYVFLLQRLCELSKKVEKEVKHWLIYAEDNRKLNVPVIVTLVRTSFINVQELDAQLASIIRRSYAPEMMDFVSDLIRACSLAEDAVISRTGFAACLAALLDAHDKSRSTQIVDALLADMRGPRQTSDQLVLEPINDATKSPDIDPELKERLAQFFLEWVRMYSKSKPESAFVPYVQFLQKEEILRGDDVSSAFYRTAINTAVDLDTAKLDVDPSFYGTDALANLIVLIIKHCGDKNTPVGIEKQVYYFNKILTIASYTLIQRHSEESFSQRPWTRFFSSILSELCKFKSVLPETHTGCLKSFANVLGFMQPIYAPKFAFGWLSILSHRLFMPALLGMPREDGWADYNRALMWLLRFLEHFFQGEMTHPSRGIYQATIRLLLVILHDFPEFLDEFYHPLTTAIPHNCLQLRNIVLSAFPDSIKPLPDVYTRLDALVPEMQHFPTVRADYVESLSAGGVRAAIDQHDRTGVPALNAIVVELKNRIAVKTMEGGEPRINWNRTLLHAAVFYLGTTCVARVARQRGVAEFDAKAPEVAILTELMRALDSDGQHYMLSVIADQLRYPSAHTLFFIHLVLFMFHHFVRQDPTVAEYISRVVLERIIVHRPHPWGLVVTFVELLDNEVYNFWGQGFVRSEEEIFMLFATAQKSIAGQAGHGSGGQSTQGTILPPPGAPQGYAGQERSVGNM